MDCLLVRDARSFRNLHTPALARLTLLVGENSSGKSTLLALARIAWDLAFAAAEPNFNEEPFSLGAFDDIAHYHGGQGKRAKSFEVGFSQRYPSQSRQTGTREPITVKGTFTSAAGQPSLTSLHIASGPWSVAAHKANGSVRLELNTPAGEFEFSSHLQLEYLNPRGIFYLLDPLRFTNTRGAQRELFEGSLPTERQSDRILKLLSLFRPIRTRTASPWGRPLATAPIRTQPKRTYDPVQEARSPEGGHVPMLLARLNSTAPDEWKELETELAAYGRASGLFEDLFVRRFTKSESAPFQLRVKLSRQKKEVNLLDVGYGVSQVLPMLVEPLNEQQPAMFLLQQPEVHLHPRAQAELGTFLASMVARRNHRFLVETHSDHIIDRVRLAVRDELIPSNAVNVLYLDRSHGDTQVYSLELDPQGNLVSPPEEYRTFFLQEELRLIGAT